MPDEAGGTTRTRERGREATASWHVPPSGWNDILRRAWQEISDNNIFLAAGGVTYALVLALVPGLAALISIYGLLMDPGSIQQQMDALPGLVPDQTRQFLSDELQQLVSTSNGALGFGAIAGLLFALWSASRGMSGMISALNVAYEEKERRGFVKLNAAAVLLTVGAIAGGILALAVIAGVPAIVQRLGFGSTTKWVLLIVEWPILMALLMLGLAVLYRYGPSREKPRWRWLSPGAAAATTVWIMASIGFTIYVAHFSSYDKTYGTLGGAVILLTWLYISSFAVLLGAVINAQAELQTRKDTTDETPRSMDQRGAHAADRIGPSASG
jgi:membrane protein